MLNSPYKIQYVYESVLRNPYTLKKPSLSIIYLVNNTHSLMDKSFCVWIENKLNLLQLNYTYDYEKSITSYVEDSFLIKQN